LWNAAGVAFYEHLFDYPPYSERVIPWWSARIVFTQWQLWEAMGAPPEWARLQPRLAEKRSAGEREVEAARRTGGN
jgi:hypothetical protein